ncbi:STAS/SEC14 domain-containing protein [Natronobacterium texcoconense]|uniref:SpoIIAA-like n=1 Tax=Natronobacterium texcoconense TaxID=1095778 RepID=A0A1H0ZF13_NATTX|nr:STAS/SEC14 domain-containing protein [Natronobacterium texcoconense]SDQ26007.1 SpoIIAA-like [Natronobacterium texcoconense]
MAYYESDELTIEWDTTLQTVVMDWHNFAEGDAYRDGLNAGLELVEEKNAANWLADLRNLGTLRQADQEWTQNDWHPRAFESTLKNIAIVQPESVVANLSVEELVAEVGDNTTSHIFDDREDARSWLQEQ